MTLIAYFKRVLLNRGAYWISRFRLRKILKGIGKNSLVIDCGANVGDISSLFLEKGAEVIAFEPDPMAYRHLLKRFAGHPRYTLYQKAVSDQSGTAEFFFHKERKQSDNLAFSVSSSLIGEKTNIDKDHSVEVELVDLSAFIKDLGRQVDLLKIDVEGAEVGILQKMLREGTYQSVGLMLVETHETKIISQKPAIDMIKEEIRDKKLDHILLNWI